MTRHPRTIGVDQPISTARRLMRESAADHLPVLADGLLVGVVTARDIEVASLAEIVDDEDVPVSEIMDDTPLVVPPETRLGTVARRMAKEAHECCVVVDHGHVVGLLRSTDALAALVRPSRQAS